MVRLWRYWTLHTYVSLVRVSPSAITYSIGVISSFSRKSLPYRFLGMPYWRCNASHVHVHMSICPRPCPLSMSVSMAIFVYVHVHADDMHVHVHAHACMWHVTCRHVRFHESGMHKKQPLLAPVRTAHSSSSMTPSSRSPGGTIESRRRTPLPPTPLITPDHAPLSLPPTTSSPRRYAFPQHPSSSPPPPPPPAFHSSRLHADAMGSFGMSERKPGATPVPLDGPTKALTDGCRSP